MLKKTFIISLLIFTLFSCFKDDNSDKKTTDLTINNLDTWSVVKNQDSLPKDNADKKTTDKIDTSLEKVQLNNVYIELYKMDLDKKSKLNCKWIYSSFKKYNSYDSYVEKCENLKKDSLKKIDLNKAVKSLNNLLFKNLDKEKLNKIIWSYKITIKDKLIVEDLAINNNEKWIKIENWYLPDWIYTVVITKDSINITY